MFRSALSSLFLLPAVAFPQDKVPGSTATVSGHVYNAESNVPLRNADVFLIPAGQIDKSVKDSGKGYRKDPSGRLEKTLLDGSFTMAGVAPGVYYVTAVKSGYISALDQLRMHPAEELSDQDKRTALLNGLPTATVESNQPVAVNVMLARDTSISGTVLYDDGSPADSVRLSVLYRYKDHWKEFPTDGEEFNPRSFSDDTGNYRLSGLPPGEYIVKVDLQLEGHTTMSWRGNGTSISGPGFYDLVFYSGNKLRPSEAVGFKLGEGESRSGEDIEVAVTRVHSISGHLTAASDGHLLNAGNINLLHADDRSQVASASLSHDDIVFHFDRVPEGDYILRVEWTEDANYYKEARNPLPGPVKYAIKSYASTEQPIQITGDQIDLLIALPSENSSRAAN